MLREIVLDTETTGFDPERGDRLIEVGAVELINHLPTGNNFHEYVDPQRDVPEDAVKVHGITTEFLKGKPLFEDIADSFLDFVQDSTMVIHNAAFDMKFLNFELNRCGRPTLPWEQSLDTLAMARKKFPGAPNTLDALVRRYEITDFSRDLHGALLDSEILAAVYLELIGGRQPGMELGLNGAYGDGDSLDRPFREPRNFEIPEIELQAHAKMLEKLKDPLWYKLGMLEKPAEQAEEEA